MSDQELREAIARIDAEPGASFRNPNNLQFWKDVQMVRDAAEGSLATKENPHRKPHSRRADCRTCFCTRPEPKWPSGTCVALPDCNRCEGTGCDRASDDSVAALKAEVRAWKERAVSAEHEVTCGGQEGCEHSFEYDMKHATLAADAPTPPTKEAPRAEGR